MRRSLHKQKIHTLFNPPQAPTKERKPKPLLECPVPSVTTSHFVAKGSKEKGGSLREALIIPGRRGKKRT